MRILSLDLKAFGPFTETSIDLSGGLEGLHIIYGLNETGKSSALRGIEALFYGIDHQTRDSFLHENRNLRISGSIRYSDNSELAFVRRKGNINTLLDPNERPIADSVLQRYLGSVSREVFSTMFGINHETLTKGGMQLVAGGGNLSESLFAAGTGITDLRSISRGLQNEAEGIFKPRGSTQSINILINRHKNAKKISNELSLSSREWESHEKALNEAGAKREKVSKRLGVLRSDKGRLERLKEALPIITEKKEVSARLEVLKCVPLLDPSFPDERRSTVRELDNATCEADKACEDLNLIKEHIKGLSVPMRIIFNAKVITEIHKRLGSHLKAQQDLPRLKGEWEALKTDAKKILAELRPDLILEDAERLRLTEMKRVMILDLGGRYQALQDGLTLALETLDELEVEHTKAKEDLGRLETPLDISGLRSTLRRMQKYGDLEEELRTASSRLESEEKQAYVNLRVLPFWTGTLEGLEALPVPSPETIDNFSLRFNELNRQVEDISKRIKENTNEEANLDKQIKALKIAGSVPTEQDLIRERQRREHGWHLVCRAWLENEDVEEESKVFSTETPLKEAYEKSVNRADDLADRLRREAKRVEKLAQLLASREKCLEKTQALKSEHSRLLCEHGNLEEEWGECWSKVGIKPRSPKEMASWLRKQEQLVSKAAIIRERSGDVVRIEKLVREHNEDLMRHLGRLEREWLVSNESLNSNLDRCQTLIDEVEEIARRRKDIEKTIMDLEKRRSAAIRKKTKAQSGLDEWNESWGKAVVELGLSIEITPNQANAFVTKTREFLEKIDSGDKLKNRIEGIRCDAEQFKTEVKGLLEEVAPDLLEIGAFEASEELNARLIRARADNATLEQLRKQQREKDDVFLKANAIIKKMTDKLNGMHYKAGCSHPNDIEEIEQKSAERWTLENHIKQLESQLQRISHCGGLTTDEIICEAEGLNPDELSVRIEDLHHTIEEEQDLLSDLDNTIGGEERELRTMNASVGAAEAAEEAQGILSTILTYSEHYMRLRMASAILNQEMERYRRANQDPILRRAGRIFSELTSGSFSGLRQSYDDRDNPILLGVRPKGEDVRVYGMSDGTCDQLYLSLRLASLEKHIEETEPMPFIVDDILINFDNDRAKAALRVLGKLSKRTQIIFFTHHRHLIELAEANIDAGDFYTHNLQ